jgi:hypothetical protein
MGGRLLRLWKIEARLRQGDHQIRVIMQTSLLNGLTRPELACGVSLHRYKLVWVECNGHLFAYLRAYFYHGPGRLV